MEPTRRMALSADQMDADQASTSNEAEAAPTGAQADPGPSAQAVGVDTDDDDDSDQDSDLDVIVADIAADIVADIAADIAADIEAPIILNPNANEAALVAGRAAANAILAALAVSQHLNHRTGIRYRRRGKAKLLPRFVYYDGLPLAVKLHILSFLPLDDLLCSARLVNREWYELCRDTDVWRGRKIQPLTHRLTDNRLVSLVQYAQRIRYLDLLACVNVSPNGLAYALIYCRFVEFLRLPHDMVMTPGLFDFITCQCSRMKVFDIPTMSAHGINYEHIRQCDLYKFGRFKKLEYFTSSPFRREMLTDRIALKIFSGCVQLKRINLHDDQVSDETLRVVSVHSRVLEELCLINQPNITCRGVDHMGTMSNLKKLTCNRLGVLDRKCLGRIGLGCPKLLEVHFLGNAGVSAGGLELLLNQLPRLKVLYLDGTPVEDIHLNIINKSAGENLKVLSLGSATDVTIGGVCSLKNVAVRLKRLNIILDDEAAAGLQILRGINKKLIISQFDMFTGVLH